MQELANRHSELEFRLPRSGDPYRGLADITKARKELGFMPRTSLRDRLSATLQWSHNHLHPAEWDPLFDISLGERSCNYSIATQWGQRLNDPDAEFPALSVAEQDTLVAAKEQSTACNAEAVNVATTPPGPVALTVMSAGIVTNGAD